jgi:hypothetical protein
VPGWHLITRRRMAGQPLVIEDRPAPGLTRVRPALGGLCGGYAELGQEAAVVGLHPLLRQPPVLVVAEGVDHFPRDVLAGGLDRSDGRGCEDLFGAEDGWRYSLWVTNLPRLSCGV